MSFKFDPEFTKAVQPYMETLSKTPKRAVGDTEGRRAGGDTLFDLIMPAWPSMDDVEKTSTTVKAQDGHEIPVTIFRKSGSSKLSGPGVLYCHGGGYISLSVAHYQKVLEYYVSKSGVPVFAPDYRLAPEHPYPTAIEDCYSCLEWLGEEAKSQNVDPSRIAVLGDSAGGGIAAGLAIMARDKGLSPPLARQMLIGSMLDDRSTLRKQPAIDSMATWRTDDNITGWQAYLRSHTASANGVSPYAAPSRVEDVSGLASLYLEVPDIDIFRDENVTYATRIAQANIETEVHVWSGVPHSFELFSPKITATQIALQCRVKAMKTL